MIIRQPLIQLSWPSRQAAEADEQSGIAKARQCCSEKLGLLCKGMLEEDSDYLFKITMTLLTIYFIKSEPKNFIAPRPDVTLSIN
jgi:hypothetical protein